jgi:hypothetical protein
LFYLESQPAPTPALTAYATKMGRSLVLARVREYGLPASLHAIVSSFLDRSGFFEFGSGVDSTKGELGPAVIAGLEMGRLDEIEIVAVPKICLDDPPSADQFTGGRAGHGGSVGVRTKL